jgi:branched-chain amino acid transport system ATP-binding protein
MPDPTVSETPLLEVAGLRAWYGDAPALWGVDLTVAAGETVCVVGPNGAGKSTLVHAVAGLHRTVAGRVAVGGVDLAGVAAHRVCDHGVAIVPEGRRVFPHMSVLDNLTLGAYRPAARPRRAEVIEQVYELFPVLRQRTAQAAGSLSGGEQQMLALGRALMARPRLLLLDEPSLGLAPLLVKEIFAIIQKINQERGTTFLLVEQNAQIALGIADYGYIMENGRVVLDGPADKLRGNDDVREFYLGLSEAGRRKSFREVKFYKRRKRWVF